MPASIILGRLGSFHSLDSYDGNGSRGSFLCISLSFDMVLYIAYNSWFYKKEMEKILVELNNYPSHWEDSFIFHLSQDQPSNYYFNHQHLPRECQLNPKGWWIDTLEGTKTGAQTGRSRHSEILSFLYPHRLRWRNHLWCGRWSEVWKAAIFGPNKTLGLGVILLMVPKSGKH